MYYCDNCDIAYEGKNCPLCEAKEEINRLQKEIEKSNQIIDDLFKEIQFINLEGK